MRAERNAIAWGSLAYRYCDDGTTIVLADSLFGALLYGFYVFEIDYNDPNDIEGTLMTIPFEIYGPLDTRQEADKLLVALCEAHGGIADRSNLQ